MSDTEYGTLSKRYDRAFGKDVYMLGEDSDGTKYWLAAPSWDCDWYWGFGYIETYTHNSKPSSARDINSHQHAEDFLSKWFIEWNGSKPILTATTFTKEEGWELSELFKQFYAFKEIAEIYHTGGAHVTTSKVTHKSKYKARQINEVTIPRITKRILEILTPDNATIGD